MTATPYENLSPSHMISTQLLYHLVNRTRSILQDFQSRDNGILSCFEAVLCLSDHHILSIQL